MGDSRNSGLLHPEQQDGELYMGNTTVNSFDCSGWVTKRMGKVARYHDGREMERDGIGKGLFPWFIDRSEVEQAIRTAETGGKLGSAKKIRTYRKMLSEYGVDTDSQSRS